MMSSTTQAFTGSQNKEEKPAEIFLSILFNRFILIPAVFLLFLLSIITAGQITDLERTLLREGFVDVQSIDSTIMVELKYADTANFMGKAVYGELKKCYLRPEAAGKLARANRLLKEIDPQLSLLVLDGLRPRHIQRIMWDIVKNTPMRHYVANPEWGSMHNYGCAVDITIADASGKRLDMGTPVDHFGPLAQVRLEQEYLKSGALTRDQINNRLLLRKVMTDAGFYPIPIEWWHFEAFSKKHIRKTYSIVE